jgi:MYXO-CTERM domain-containing protein
MKFALALVAAAGLAATASAQNTQVTFEGSTDNGATWQGGNVAFNGGNLLVRARITLVNAGTNTVLGLAGITFQPKVTGWSAADVRNPFSSADGSGVTEEPQTNTGRIFPFASSGMGTGSASGLLTSHVDGGNTLRFAGANAVTQTTNNAWGVAIGQVPLTIGGTNFRRGTDVVVFRYSINLAQDVAARNLTATVDLSTIVQSRGSWYRTDNGVGSLFASVTSDNIAPLNITVNPVPAPGALALLGLGGLAMARRRR